MADQFTWAQRATGQAAAPGRGKPRSRVTVPTSPSPDSGSVVGAGDTDRAGTASSMAPPGLAPTYKAAASSSTATVSKVQPSATYSEAPPPAVNPWQRRLVEQTLQKSVNNASTTNGANSSSVSGNSSARSTSEVASSSASVTSTPRREAGSSSTMLDATKGWQQAPASQRRAASGRRDQSDENVLQVVEEINEKLTLIGKVETNPVLLRPLRSPREPPTACRKIRVQANHFPVKFDPKKFPSKVFHYDVVIAPKEAREQSRERGVIPHLVESTVPDRLLHLIWQTFEREFGRDLGTSLPFDGKKNCYTVKELNLGGNVVWSGDLTMTDPDDDERKRTFRIQLKFASEVATDSMFAYLQSCSTGQRVELPQDVIQALDVGLRYSPSIHYIPCNRSFYSAMRPHAISDLLELCFGHNQSLLLGRNEKATLNIDMANKAFVKRLSIIKLVELILRKNPDKLALNHWRPDDFREGNEFLKGKLLQYSTGPTDRNTGERKFKHRFVCVEIQDKDAATYTFQLQGKSMTIQEYFRNEKKIELKHPDWPVVHVGNKNMTNYVPLELLEILHQPYKGKLDAKDTTAMIKGAAKPPQDRFDRIKRSMDNCRFPKCSVLRDFGMTVEPKMVEIQDAKLLPLPSLKYRDPQGREVDRAPKGADGKFMIGKLLDPAIVPRIAVLNASGKLNDQTKLDIKHFLREFGKAAEELGLKTSDKYTSVDKLFENAKIYDLKARSVRAAGTQMEERTRENLKQIKEDTKGGLAIVIMGKDGNEYATIKSEAEVEVGILTQCVKFGTLEKVVRGAGSRQVLINIVLKLNAKLNGVSFKLGTPIEKEFGFLNEPILFLGADVTHPPQNSKSPSIAAITASTGSMESPGMCYDMHIQLQPSSGTALEVIEKPCDIIKNMILKFMSNNGGKPPRRIMMFRDGVSEGQFAEIKKQEFILGMKRACELISAKYNKPYNPKLTFLVVKKRHHTRFMPVDKRDAVKPKDNIPPGTVVDTVITHPTEMEFFLNSHVGIQGTSKPTRYHVIHDDCNFTMEQLEKLTYYLCYTFVRCTQPVSYPAPTYYAHLAAFRARALIENVNVDVLADPFCEEDRDELQLLQSKMTIHADLVKNYPMFFV